MIYYHSYPQLLQDKETTKILLQENKRLKRENHKLSESLNALQRYKDEYKSLIEDLNRVKKSYAREMDEFDKIKGTYKAELDKLMNNAENRR